jgi:hypothetical protein
VCIVCDATRVAANAALVAQQVLTAAGQRDTGRDRAELQEQALRALAAIVQAYAMTMAVIQRAPFTTLEGLERSHVQYPAGFLRDTVPEDEPPRFGREIHESQYRKEKEEAVRALLTAPGMDALWYALRLIAHRDWPGDIPEELAQQARRALEFFAVAAWLVWYHAIPPYLLNGVLVQVAEAREQYQ